MATPDTSSITINKKSQQGLLEFLRECTSSFNSTMDIRSSMEDVDRLYQREKNFLDENQKAKRANKLGDANRIQDVTVPVVYPAVEAAVVYQSSVFLTGSPMFGVVSDPMNEDSAIQMEAIIQDQQVRGGWVNELIQHFRNGFKYNIAALECDWERQTVPQLVTDATSPSGTKQKELIWGGNVIRNLDMYNTFFDLRVPPSKVHSQGEFAGYTTYMSRIRLKQYIASLPNHIIHNVTPAFESNTQSVSSSFAGGDSSTFFYIPSINPAPLIDEVNVRDTNWLAWAGMSDIEQKIQYKNGYVVTVLYARILPSDFGMKVPASNTPQVWKFVVVNSEVIIFAERLTNAHNWIPILFSQPLEDNLGLQTKSLATNVEPIQSVTSALMNSVTAARRRAIADRGIYDPSRITERNINNPNPTAKIPLRPSAYGKSISEAYYPIPFEDRNSGIVLQEVQHLMSLSQTITGQNPVRQGQFVKGNKTLHEFETVMGNANGRDQLVSMQYEAQLFTPLKHMLKINILQYQGPSSVYSMNKRTEISIDPTLLRKAVTDFKVSDGLIPSDKLVNADTLQVALQVLGSAPQMAAGYNVTPMFSYLMKTQGADLRDFEKPQQQLAYEQAMAQWQQMVNEVLMLLKTAPDQQQELLKQLPPQPKPEDFNYQPGTRKPVEKQSNILQDYGQRLAEMGKQEQQAGSEQPTKAQAQPGE